MMNVLGRHIDERGPVETEQKNPIHRHAPDPEDLKNYLNLLITSTILLVE